MSWSRPIVEWARDTFGDGPHSNYLDRAGKEWEEFLREQDPEKEAEEAADVVICLARYVHARTGNQLSDYVEMKQLINEGREWERTVPGCGRRVKSPVREAAEEVIRSFFRRCIFMKTAKL
jgi:hypothetical protein